MDPQTPLEPLGTPETHSFTADDGAKLIYRRWPAARPSAQAAGKAMMLFHRGHEHSLRWQETVNALGLDDVDVYAWDARGHGDSDGERGSARDIAQMVHDANDWARHLQSTHNLDLTNTIVIAHSVGGVVATAWVHDYAPPIRGLILATPAFAVKLYVPLAIPALKLKQKLLGPGEVRSYVKSRVLTHDPEQQKAYDADPKIFKQIAVNVLIGLKETADRLVADAGAITVPTLVLSAGKDWVVRLDVQTEFYRRLGSTLKKHEVFPDMYHAIFHESRRSAVVERVKAFALRCWDRPVARDGLVDADHGGYTRTEYDALRTPSSLKWKLTRLGLNTAGRLSDGISIGHRDGFDSGVMLDHVYRNTAAGKTFLGRMIDRNYLDAVGWKGIRVRGEHMRAMLEAEIRRQSAAGKSVHVLDVAAGAGRYVLETVKKLAGEIPVRVTLRDYKQANLDAARKLADELALPNVTVAHGDAFDRSSLASISPRPTIGIVSGLFELFPENAPLRQTLGGLHDAIEPGGALFYTCQPWHPQVEFIARALTNREGQPWVMRRRTQQEMDELARAAGFDKQDQRIDQWGIFTVSIASRL
jgi:alpha-beta hydrolase superfamily lysophospholipase/SAM-dependent methyltransferase